MRDEKKRGMLNDERGVKHIRLTVPRSSFSIHPLTSALSPQPSSLRYVFVWSVAAMLTVAFVSLIVIAPLALAHRHDFAALVIYKSFSRFCHQIPERSFYIDGHPFAVCARCTGIYFGFAAGVLLYPLVRSLKRSDAPGRKWLLVALVPTALDFALDFFGIWENTHLSRSATGALLGAITAFYVVPGLLDLSRMSFRRSIINKESLGSEGVTVHEQ